jgi:hypothetical protein
MKIKDKKIFLQKFDQKKFLKTNKIEMIKNFNKLTQERIIEAKKKNDAQQEFLKSYYLIKLNKNNIMKYNVN